MTISKRTMVQFFLLAMTGVGVAMCVGILIGTNLTASDDDVSTAEPVALAVAQDTPSLGCELVPVTTDTAALEAAEDNQREGRQERDNSGANAGANSATNSGSIDGSQFSDGGFGDIGQQWWNVVVNGNVTNVHVSGTGNVVAAGNETITNVEVTVPVDVPPVPVPVPVIDSTPTATTPVTTTPVTTPSAPTTTATTQSAGGGTGGTGGDGGDGASTVAG